MCTLICLMCTFFCVQSERAYAATKSKLVDGATYKYDTDTSTLTITGSGTQSLSGEAWTNTTTGTGENEKVYYDGSVAKTCKKIVIDNMAGARTAFWNGWEPSSVYTRVEIVSMKDNKIPSSFCNSKNVYEVALDKSITEIGSYAFADSSIYSLIIYKGSKLTTIGSSAFSNCTRLNYIYTDGVRRLPNAVKSIPDYAFYNCENFRPHRFNYIESIGKYAFHGCKNFLFYNSNDSYTANGLPSSLKQVGDYAFAYSGINSGEKGLKLQ